MKGVRELDTLVRNPFGHKCMSKFIPCLRCPVQTVALWRGDHLYRTNPGEITCTGPVLGRSLVPDQSWGDHLYRTSPGEITCTGPILVGTGWQYNNGIGFSPSNSVSPRRYHFNMPIFVFIFVWL